MRAKKFLSMLLVVVMMLSLFPMNAFALGGGREIGIGGGFGRDIGDDEIREFDPTDYEAEGEDPVDFFQATDYESGITVTVASPFNALPTKAEVRLQPVDPESVRQAVESVVEGQPNILVAMDISFWLDGQEIEPDQPVNVKISAPELTDVQNLQVIHIPDADEEGAQPNTVELVTEEEMSIPVGTNEIAFKADSFSVYAVIGGGEDYSNRVTVNFYKTKGDKDPIATVYVKDADTEAEVEKIVYDPGVPALSGNTLFQGWCRLDGENDAITLDTETLTIEQIRKQILDMEITEDVTVNYYAVIYKYFDISYYADDLCYGSDTVLLLLDGESAEYTVSMLYQAGSEQNFEGWKVSDGIENIISATLPDEDHTQLSAGQIDSNTVFPNDTVIVIKGDVVFDVEAPDGHWLVFHENPKNENAGATYIAPQFLEQADTTKDPQAGEGGIPMKCPGYTFDGWYLGTTDGEGNFDDYTTQFTFGSTIDSTTHVYAKWSVATSAYYTLIYWKENLNGDGWDFYASEQVTNQTPGSAITYTDKYANHADFEGFGFDRTDIGEGANAKTVKADSSTIVNVYYTRNLYKLTFNDPGSNYITYVYNNRAYEDATVSSTAVSNTSTINTLENAARKKTINGYEVSYYTTTSWMSTTEHYCIKKADGKWYEITSYGSDVYGASEINALPRPAGSKVIEAKYGANIADQFPITCSNGVTYNHGERWSPQNDKVWKEVMVIVDKMPSRDVTFQLDLGVMREDCTIYYYVEALSSDTNTRTYNGAEYVLYTDDPVKAKYNGVTEEDFIDLNGFTKVAVADENNNTLTPIAASEDGAKFYRQNSDSDPAYNVYFYYSRDKYKVTYQEGAYFGGKDGKTPMNVIQPEKDLGESTPIFFNADISAYGDKENAVTDPKTAGYFNPASKVDGYVFAGWYVDDSCSKEYEFKNMPLEGVVVYAKWVQVRYRVFLHPNVPSSDTSLNWGSADQQMNFGVAFGDKISAPFGTRDGYVFLGWTRADGSAFNSDFVALTDSTVPADPVYNKTVDMTDKMDIYGNVSDPKSNSDADRFWVTRKLDLYGKWRKVTPGADGIGVIYDLNGGEGDVRDTSLYPDNTEAIAQTAPTGAPKTADGKDQHFLYWVVQKWDAAQEKYVDATDESGNSIFVSPGSTYTVLLDNAKREEKWQTNVDGSYVLDDQGNKIQEVKIENGKEVLQWYYTVQLRAEYGPLDTPTPTHIYWYANNGTDGVQKDDNVQINKGVDIPTTANWTNDASRAAGEGLVYEGHVFLGWARVKAEDGSTVTPSSLTVDDLFLKWVDATDTVPAHYEAQDKDRNWVTVTQVACDEKSPYHDLYAVWGTAFYVYHTGDNKVERILLSGSAVETEGTAKTFDLTALVDTSKFLYGGYSLGYTGVSENFSVNGLSWTTAAASAYAGGTQMNGYATDGLVATATDAGTRYMAANIDKVSFSDVQEARGDQIKPAAGAVYYIKEVPANEFLTPKLRYTFRSIDGKIGTAWLVTNMDDNSYSKVGFIIGGIAYDGDKVETVTIEAKVGDYKEDFTNANLFDGNGKMMSYRMVYNFQNLYGEGDPRNVDFPDIKELEANKLVQMFWVTPDGMKVTSTQSRIYEGIESTATIKQQTPTQTSQITYYDVA